MTSILDVFRTPQEVDKAAQDFVASFNNTQDLQYKQACDHARVRPEHKPVAPCMKCGNSERHSTTYKRHEYVNSKQEKFMDEWLARKCACCGFQWNEAVVTN
jgi:hypothetical protein